MLACTQLCSLFLSHYEGLELEPRFSALCKLTMRILDQQKNSGSESCPFGVCYVCCWATARGTLEPCMVQELRLRGCRFKQLPDWVPELPSLQHLYLIGCELPSWQQQQTWRRSAPALKSLHCSFSRIGKVCTVHSSATHMAQDTGCRQTTTPSASCAGVPNGL